MKIETALDAWTCPMPIRNYPHIVAAHGSGGKIMHDLIQHLFLPIFDSRCLRQQGDSALLDLPLNASAPERIAFSTDSYVVSPLFFPNSDIGELAVNGTINDLAVSGARPLFLSAGFILEEGLPVELLARVARSMARACQLAGVELVCGDTKVVAKGHGDGLYINTAGIGLVPAGVEISAAHARPGDALILSGSLGDHGMAVISVRAGLEFDTIIQSDTAPLHQLVQQMLSVSSRIHCMRDATRGGLAAVLNEIAASSHAGIEIDEACLPVRPPVQAACEMLGLDPLYVANEGKLVAVLPDELAPAMLEAMRRHPLGREAAIIGRVVSDHAGLVVARTPIGGSRVIDLPAGELLPRIC